MASKNPLKTSEEVYHRLRWDPALPASRVWIGYLDRMVGERELPLQEFTPGGRIPWSRIWFFRLDEERIWDRRTRLDRVFGSGDTPADQVLPRLQQHTRRADGVSAHPTYRYSADQDAWRPSKSPPEPLPSRLSVVTLNVLFDTYQPEALDSARRYAAIIEMLEEMSPDLIALQEVKRPFLEQLLETRWARRYTCSDVPEKGITLKPYGQVLLSRQQPSRLLMVRLSNAKRAIVVAFETGAVPLEVAVVHLTSDHREDAHERRTAQVSRILSAMDPGADHIIVGDFNHGDDQSIAQLSAYTDAWRHCHPDRPGFTYAPSHNRLAAINSRLGIDRRLDRLVFRAPPDRILASDAAVIADQPIAGAQPVLHPSDHFGLRVSLMMGATRSALEHSPTTVMSALAVLPPLASWGPLQALRRRHDPSFERWMPHINLLYGFFSPTLQPAAAAVAAAVVAEDATRTITLDRVEVFRHKGSTTVYLAPDPPSAAWLSALQARLRAALPQCSDQERDGGFTPHLTVARLPRHAPIPAAAQALVPCTFPVSALSVLRRTDRTPFSEAIRIPLGGGPIDHAPPAPGRTLAGSLELLGLSPVASGQREQAWEAVRVAAEGRLFLMGSSRLGLARPDSDLDVLLVGRGPRAAAWSALEKALGVAGRWVDAARVPVLKLVVHGVSVDVLYAVYPQALPLVDPCDLSAEQWASLDLASRQAAVACREAEALLAAIGAWRSVWQVTARALRAWAAARQIDVQSVGFPGGLAWAIISATVPPRTSPEAWLEDILESLLSKGWEQPRGLGVLPEPADDPVTVWTSCAPRHNATASVLACTRAVLQAELERALELSWTIRDGQQGWAILFEPVTAAQLASRIVLRVVAPAAPDAVAGLGWLRGNLLSLLIALETLLGEQVRPLSSPRDGAMVIGLQPPPQGEQLRRIHERLDAFVAQFPGPGRLDAQLTVGPA